MIEDEMCPVECVPRASRRGSRELARLEEVRREEVRLRGHREVCGEWERVCEAVQRGHGSYRLACDPQKVRHAHTK